MEQNQSFQEMVERYRQQLLELQRRAVPAAEEEPAAPLAAEQPVMPAAEPTMPEEEPGMPMAENDFLSPFFDRTTESFREEPVVPPSCSDLWV